MNKLMAEKLLLAALLIAGAASVVVMFNRLATVSSVAATAQKKEADDSFAQARAIQPGDETSAVFSSPTDKDYFSFTVDKPSIATIELIHIPPNTRTQLYDPSKNLISQSTVFQPVDDRSSQLHLYRAGTYYIVLSNIGITQAQTPYSINLSFTTL